MSRVLWDVLLTVSTANACSFVIAGTAPREERRPAKILTAVPPLDRREDLQPRPDDPLDYIVR